MYARQLFKGVLKRCYHSEKVFGYKRKPPKIYKVDDKVLKQRCNESNFYRLVTAYRTHGHKCSHINPVDIKRETTSVPELEIARYGLSGNENVMIENILNYDKTNENIKGIVQFLKQVYCSNIAAEFSYLESEEEKEWFASELEKLPSKTFDKEIKIKLATELLKCKIFDQFMGLKFGSVKRYGADGAESIMAFFDHLFRLSAQDNSLEQIVLASPHRGRLNLLTGLLNVPPVKIFHKLKGCPDFPPNYQCSGDVLSHLISSTDLHYDGKSIQVSLLYNPSHLEAVNPVSMGKTRAKQMMVKDGDYGNENQWADKILNIQIHGDAALIGQGVNQECLTLCKVPNFEIGGTIHFVVNNQLGFTTPADRGRSSRYCTDLAKIIDAPVLHVNCEYPEEVLKVTELAFEYQRKFRKDIFIDFNCYRWYGHNELDDPTFTNPVLYKIIRSKTNVSELYTSTLIKENILTQEQCKNIVEDHKNLLNKHLKLVDDYRPEDNYFKKQWEGFCQPFEVVSTWDTGIDLDLMTFVGSKSVKCPEDFEIHPTLARTHVKNRISKASEGINIDWSTAETLAFGSLLFQGFNVRLSGEDVGRGTFSQRHVMLVDQKTNQTYIPLNNLHPNQKAFLEVANSVLSEEAVLGFEYGMSVENPNNLIIWEAQFGDFFNGAQIILDTFITTGESKWLWQSGLVILLPHGYDGAGPEHSSSRIERFLQSCNSKEDKVDSDNVNMEISQPSTPAQYFHLLRRQMVRNFRKPHVVITPKTLLRDPVCVSNFADMTPGTHFKTVLGDDSVPASNVKRILITSGKHYYTLANKRNALEVRDTAIIRLESFCPFPAMELQNEVAKYPNAKVFVWCQEEHRNMGAWTFFKPRFENLIGRKVFYCGRDTAAAPAVGVKQYHDQEVEYITSTPFQIN